MKIQQAVEELLEMLEYDIAADMAAEQLGIWVATGHMLVSYCSPFLVRGPTGLTLAKIFIDFVIQLTFELAADAISVYLVFHIISLLPSGVFDFRSKKVLWVGFVGAVIFVCSYTFPAAYECMSCHFWDAEKCLGRFK